jgi:hypothetical protein
MKICWDNLENIRLNKNGCFRDAIKKVTYYYIESCRNCGEPFLSSELDGNFCSKSCANTGKNNSMHGKFGELNNMYGKRHTEEARKKIREKHHDVSGRHNPMYGKHHTEETKRKISSRARGYFKNNIPVYNTYAHQIDWCEKVRRNADDLNILEVQCTYCGRWYVPTINNVHHRAQFLKGSNRYKGEHRLYCSEQCKQACPIYHKRPNDLMKEDAVRAGRLKWLEMNREVQPELRQMVLERDEYRCRKCGATDKPLHCHHILPVAVEPLLSADIDNCMTLCVDCHKEVHQKDGCKLNQLRIEVC